MEGRKRWGVETIRIEETGIATADCLKRLENLADEDRNGLERGDWDGMMKEIDHPEEYTIVQFDGVTMSAVYAGSFGWLRSLEPLEWRQDVEASEMIGMEIEVLTLKEISDQAKKIGAPMVTVFIESPLGGTILQYGNYGDSWWQVGVLGGYA